jgi:hypothetical protein
MSDVYVCVYGCVVYICIMRLLSLFQVCKKNGIFERTFTYIFYIISVTLRDNCCCCVYVNFATSCFNKFLFGTVKSEANDAKLKCQNLLPRIRSISNLRIHSDLMLFKIATSYWSVEIV